MTRAVLRFRLLAMFATVFALALVLNCELSPLVGGDCAFGLTNCDQSCVDLSLDSNNCGSCGNVCAEGFSCQVGNCRAAADDSGAAVEPREDMLPDGSLPRSDAGDSRSGGSSVDGSAGGPLETSDGGRADAGEPLLCVPPFNRSDQCGACDVACPASAPFCARAGESFECVEGCEEPTVLCSNRCVDITSDPFHCGRCNNLCPTGLCRNSRCIGDSAGHIVIACFSYEQVQSTSPQTTMLGNAVFLNPAEEVRILVYDRRSSDAAKINTNRAVTWSAASRGRAFEVTSTASPTMVAESLSAPNFDVFLMLDQQQAEDGELMVLGQLLAIPLESFTRGGGIAIVLTGPEASGISEFLGSDGAGLIDIPEVTSITGRELDVRAPSDSLAANVLTPFLALRESCAFSGGLQESLNLASVVSVTPGEGEMPAPVVFHRVVPLQ